MIEFLLTFLILLMIVSGMAIGVMRGRKPISGSCGGLNNIGLTGGCEICGGDAAKCEAEQDNRGAATTSYYDAS